MGTKEARTRTAALLPILKSVLKNMNKPCDLQSV
jgi:hypothetical protein